MWSLSADVASGAIGGVGSSYRREDEGSASLPVILSRVGVEFEQSSGAGHPRHRAQGNETVEDGRVPAGIGLTGGK